MMLISHTFWYKCSCTHFLFYGFVFLLSVFQQSCPSTLSAKPLPCILSHSITIHFREIISGLRSDAVKTAVNHWSTYLLFMRMHASVASGGNGCVNSIWEVHFITVLLRNLILNLTRKHDSTLLYVNDLLSRFIIICWFWRSKFRASIPIQPTKCVLMYTEILVERYEHYRKHELSIRRWRKL